SIASETRSSTSTTAQLKDFILGGFGKCESGLTTTPQYRTGTNPDTYANITASLSLTGGSITVRDEAVLTITGSSSWSGNLNFYLCGPGTTTSLADGCLSGGAGPFLPDSGNPVTGGTAAVTKHSVTTTVTTPGVYRWRAEFTAITNNVPSVTEPAANSTGDVSECFTVRSPSKISTQQFWTPNDKATVTWSGGPIASATLTFTLYQNDATHDCDSNGAATPVTLTANSNVFNLTNVSSGFDRTTSNTEAVGTPGGKYSWKVVFSGGGNVDGHTW